MTKIAIVTDSTAYLPKAFIESNNIKVVPLKIHWDGDDFEDGASITPAEFYERLEKSLTIPTTSQPTAEEFLRIFEELTPHCDGIVVPLISSGISGTVNSAQIAVSMFSKVPVEIIDSGFTGAGLALIIKAIAQDISEGKSLMQVKYHAEEIIQRMSLFFVVDTLKYLHKGGRIGGASRYLGTVLSIKPILFLDGTIDALEKVRTKRKAIERLIDLVVEKAAGKPAWVGVMHANSLEEAKILQGYLQLQINCKEIEIYEISPVIGTHVGPGTLGVAIYPE